MKTGEWRAQTADSVNSTPPLHSGLFSSVSLRDEGLGQSGALTEVRKQMLLTQTLLSCRYAVRTPMLDPFCVSATDQAIRNRTVKGRYVM